jgi:hypothetical protein
MPTHHFPTTHIPDVTAITLAAHQHVQVVPQWVLLAFLRIRCVLRGSWQRNVDALRKALVHSADSLTMWQAAAKSSQVGGGGGDTNEGPRIRDQTPEIHQDPHVVDLYLGTSFVSAFAVGMEAHGCLPQRNPYCGST